MEKIEFVRCGEPHGISSSPHWSYRSIPAGVKSDAYYRASEVDAERASMLAAVRGLVEAAGKSVWFEKQHLKATCPGCLEYPNDTCSHGEEFSPIVQLLTQAIDAVERHLEKVA